MKTKGAKSKTQNFYDQIADVHNLALKINGYRASVEKFLRSLDLKIDENSIILDAGSGTGIVTLGFYSANFHPQQTIALDLSQNSLEIARAEFRRDKKTKKEKIAVTQGNVLQMPFADETFDLILTCGVLEYVPLDEGLREMARLLKPGARLILIPVKPSLVGAVLEIIYKFKIHSIEDVRKISQKYFNIVGDYEFPLIEPISWSKKIFLLEKK